MHKVKENKQINKQKTLTRPDIQCRLRYTRSVQYCTFSEMSCLNIIKESIIKIITIFWNRSNSQAAPQNLVCFSYWCDAILSEFAEWYLQQGRAFCHGWSQPKVQPSFNKPCIGTFHWGIFPVVGIGIEISFLFFFFFQVQPDNKDNESVDLGDNFDRHRSRINLEFLHQDCIQIRIGGLICK